MPFYQYFREEIGCYTFQIVVPSSLWTAPWEIGVWHPDVRPGGKVSTWDSPSGQFHRMRKYKQLTTWLQRDFSYVMSSNHRVIRI